MYPPGFEAFHPVLNSRFEESVESFEKDIIDQVVEPVFPELEFEPYNPAAYDRLPDMVRRGKTVVFPEIEGEFIEQAAVRTLLRLALYLSYCVPADRIAAGTPPPARFEFSESALPDLFH